MSQEVREVGRCGGTIKTVTHGVLDHVHPGLFEVNAVKWDLYPVGSQYNATRQQTGSTPNNIPDSATALVAKVQGNLTCATGGSAFTNWDATVHAPTFTPYTTSVAVYLTLDSHHRK